MKYSRLFLFIAFPASVLLHSCANEVDVTAPYKEIPVVYGLLNPADSFQYVKVNKAFLNEEGDAFMAAQVPDSLYHPDAMSVRLVKVTNSTAGQIIMLDSVIVPKEEGVFGGLNQLLYRTPAGTVIDPDSRYDLQLIRKKDDKVIGSASTQIVNDFQLAGFLYEFDFYQGGEYKSQLVEWMAAKDGRLYEVVLRLNYSEVNKTTNETVQKYVDWQLADRIKTATLSGSERLNIGIDGEEFYRKIQVALDPDPAVDRYANPKLELRYAVAAEDLSIYIEVNRPNENVNDVPVEYTNIDKGLGIFSSRFNKSIFKNMTLASLGELKTGKITGDLGFK